MIRTQWTRSMADNWLGWRPQLAYDEVGRGECVPQASARESGVHTIHELLVAGLALPAPAFQVG